MHFENLPTTPRSEELIDKAFSRAARAGRAKEGKEAQESMLQTASNILSDNLQNVVTTWPDFEAVDEFYYELADATLAETDVGGVDALRQHLSEVMWAGRQADKIKEEYHSRIRNADTETARKHRKQAFARLADVTEQVEDDLLVIGEAREALKTLPDIRADEPAIVIAGFPNVGKSTFVNNLTNTSIETAAYPFTTTRIHVGHVERNHIRYQLIDTPGLLDRPAEERNAIESQAVSALTHLADAVLVMLDASGDCGYPLESQLELLADIESQFDAPIVTVCNKADRSTDVEADYYMSVEPADHGVTQEPAETESDEPKPTVQSAEAVLDAVIEAVGYEPELPFEE